MFNSRRPYMLLTIKYEEDPAFHIKTFIYRTYTSAGKYIIHIEEYQHKVFVIKFYPALYKRYANKYRMISDDHVMQEVVGTSLQILLDFFNKNDGASCGFVATASLIGAFSEFKSNNQRFRIYRQVMQNFFGHETFSHFVDNDNSAYLMVNRSTGDINSFVAEMQVKFSEMYPEMFNLQFKQI
jgi:hypothetical protein